VTVNARPQFPESAGTAGRRSGDLKDVGEKVKDVFKK
jgi:hypothetical protein